MPYNIDITNWDVSEVTNMSKLFSQCPHFNQPFNWNTSNVQYMNHMVMVSQCHRFNQPITFSDTTNVTNM